MRDARVASGSATEASSSVDSSIANTPDTDESSDVSYIYVGFCLHKSA